MVVYTEWSAKDGAWQSQLCTFCLNHSAPQSLRNVGSWPDIPSGDRREHSPIRERLLMASADFRRFLTYLPTLFNPKISNFWGHFEPPNLS